MTPGPRVVIADPQALMAEALEKLLAAECEIVGRVSDGRALLTIYSLANEARDTPASYLKTNLRLSRSSLDYERITPAFFAISSVRDDLVYYSRCNFSAGADAALHCVDLVYPQREQRAWDAIVTRISRSLRPLERGV